MILKIDELNISREIREGEIISIGRKGFGADIEINESNVSRMHGNLRLEGEQIMIFDNNSLNGIMLNGHKIEPGKWYNVIDTDEINILGFGLKFYPEPKSFVSTPKNDSSKAYVNLNAKFKELINLKMPVKIGRLPTNDILLPDELNNDKIVSRNHAEIFFKDGQYWIKDLNSTNGTYVNDEKIAPLQPKPLEEKDTILIHLHYFNLVEGYRDLREEVAIRAEGIGKTYTNGFVGLKPMSVEIPYKQMVALMGPSGCGKSTLLKALNGDNPATSGNVFIHGLALRENYQLLKRKIGYVPQDDTIHSDLTVEKTLYTAGKLRLPDDTTNEEIGSRITDVLASLNFKDAVRNKKVGELSGGQRKRVCIAVELLSRPTILFLDEPTSPLDPETIEEFLLSLQKLRHNGTTIIMVTHKPEDLNYVDKVIFMAKEGYFVYYGDKANLIERFKVKNIVQVYSVCGGEDFNHEDYYIKPTGNIIPRKAGSGVALDKQNSLFLQLYWLCRRYLSIKINDRYNLYLLLAQPFIIAGLVSFIFHEVKVQVMMLIAISAIWFGVSNASKEIVGEFSVYKRERMFNLNIHTYILSKWAILSLIALLQVLIFLAIIHIRFGMGSNNVLGSYMQNAFYTFYIASSATLFGLFLSSYFNTTEKVLTVVPIALMPQIMLAGVVEPIVNMKINFFSYLTLGRWGTEGLIRLQHGPFKRPFALEDLYYNPTLRDKGGQVVNAFNSTRANILCILVITILMYILTYFSLKRKDTI